MSRDDTPSPVQTPAQAALLACINADRAGVARVFEHWLALTPQGGMRRKLTPDRRSLIRRMRDLYGTDTLLLAIEGAVWEWRDDARRWPDLSAVLRCSARIERLAEQGEELRRRAGETPGLRVVQTERD